MKACVNRKVFECANPQSLEFARLPLPRERAGVRGKSALNVFYASEPAAIHEEVFGFNS